jgi:hypothetical protein
MMTTLPKHPLPSPKSNYEENHENGCNAAIVWQDCFVALSSMDFSSVGDFLRKAASAKQDRRKTIDENLAPFLEDPATIGIPPSLSESIEALLEQHGDETYRQVAIFCIGKWHSVHTDILQEHVDNDGMSEALLTMNDLSKLSSVLQMLEQVGSFGGDDSWRKMLRKIVGQSVLETLEEHGSDPESFFYGKS